LHPADCSCAARFRALGDVTMTRQEWSRLRPPTLADIEALADAAYAALPQRFTRLCQGLVIRVEDFPDEETLDDMQCESEFELLGLFRGRGLTQGAHLSETGEQPNMVWLYRRPILDYWAESEDTLEAIVTHVLVHEIGHHFGLTDDDMEEIERRAG
jgi:predicted Zn-dependent protease with MMP-like domain